MQKRLRYADLKALGVIKNRPTLRNWIQKYGFPKGQRIGPNTRVWGEADVQKWLDRRPTDTKPGPVIKRRRPGRPRKNQLNEILGAG